MPEFMMKTRFQLGDQVLCRATGHTYRVTDVEPVYSLEHSDGTVITVNEGSLEPAPKPLPDDHLDRYMVEHAIIMRRTNGERRTYLVLPGRRLKRFKPEGLIYSRSCFEHVTGWSFHEDSPIQTPLEPGQ